MQPVTSQSLDKVEAGQYWLDMEASPEQMYIVVELPSGPSLRYALVNLNTGCTYLGDTIFNINDIFGNDREDFTLLPQVTISPN